VTIIKIRAAHDTSSPSNYDAYILITNCRDFFLLIADFAKLASTLSWIRTNSLVAKKLAIRKPSNRCTFEKCWYVAFEKYLCSHMMASLFHG
jgi:hypothetical protein